LLNKYNYKKKVFTFAMILNMKKIKIDLLMETFLREAQTALFEPTKEGALDFGNQIKSSLSGLVPEIRLSTGVLSRYDYVDIILILQPKEKWANGLVENAASMRFEIKNNGKIEMTHSRLYVKSKRPIYALPVKFVKQSVKDASQAAEKIKKVVEKAKELFAQAGEPLE
jgi:hypothetical protein